MITPNSDVARNTTIQADANLLASTLRRICIDTPSSPVRILFQTNGTLSVWTHDVAKTMHLYLNHSPIAGMRVKEDCILLVNPLEFSDLLSTKFSGKTVRIETSANQPIEVRSKDGSQATYFPADEDDCAMVPDRFWLEKNSEGWIMIQQQDNEVCTTMVSTSRQSLSQGVVDMKVASAPYVVFKFSKQGSSCSSGHWGSKTNKSSSPIQADVEGEDVEIGLTSILTTVLSTSNSDEFTLFKHKAMNWVVIESGDIRMVVAETTKEV